MPFLDLILYHWRWADAPVAWPVFAAQAAQLICDGGQLEACAQGWREEETNLERTFEALDHGAQEFRFLVCEVGVFVGHGEGGV